jgi:hypothetical protein
VVELLATDLSDYVTGALIAIPQRLAARIASHPPFLGSPFRVAEAGHLGLDLGREPAWLLQLAFERGEEALAHGVVVGIADR